LYVIRGLRIDWSRSFSTLFNPFLSTSGTNQTPTVSQLLIITQQLFLDLISYEHYNPCRYTFNWFSGFSSLRNGDCQNSQGLNRSACENYHLQFRKNNSDNQLVFLRVATFLDFAYRFFEAAFASPKVVEKTLNHVLR
jgi:hypothetical protein